MMIRAEIILLRQQNQRINPNQISKFALTDIMMMMMILARRLYLSQIYTRCSGKKKTLKIRPGKKTLLFQFIEENQLFLVLKSIKNHFLNGFVSNSKKYISKSAISNGFRFETISNLKPLEIVDFLNKNTKKNPCPGKIPLFGGIFPRHPVYIDYVL